MATTMKTESKPEPACTRPASCSARITPLMVPCRGKAIFSKFIVYLNRAGALYLAQKKERVGPI